MRQEARSATAPPDGSPHVVRLDGLRGIAILLVVAGHAGDYSLGYHKSGELGAVAVLLFFILSGYLITGLLDRELDRSGRIDVPEFYLRRALRILPALWVLLLVVSILKLTGLVTDITWKAVLACLFFVRNFRGRGQSLGHIWSLSLQEQFYVAWPVVMARLSRQRVLKVSAALIGACVVWRTAAILLRLYPWETDVFYLRTDFRLDSILVGCWLALAWRDEAIRPRLSAIFARAPFLLTVPLLLGWALLAPDMEALHPFFLTVETVLALLIFGRLLTVDAAHPLVRVFSNPALGAIGRMSYSIYLWQQLFVVTSEPSWGVIREFPWSLLSVAAASLLSYFLIEKPSLEVRRRWLRKRKGTGAA